MDAEVNRPQPLWQIFLASFKLYKKIWLHLMPVTVLLGILVVSPNLWIYNPKNPWLFVGYLILSIFVFNASMYYAEHANKGEPIYLSRAMLVTAEKMPIVFVTSVLAALITFIAYSFLIVPGVIATVWLSMCMPLILFENENPFSAFHKSYELTTDEWRRTSVIVFLPFFLISMVGFSIRELFIFFNLNFLYFKIVLGAFVFIFSLFYLPWIAALIILQFEDLKMRKALRSPVAPQFSS